MAETILLNGHDGANGRPHAETRVQRPRKSEKRRTIGLARVALSVLACFGPPIAGYYSLSAEGPLLAVVAYLALTESLFIARTLLRHREARADAGRIAAGSLDETRRSRFRITSKGMVTAALVTCLFAGAAVIIIGLNITPASAYLAWFALVKEGVAGGTIATMFVVKFAFFSAVFAGVVLAGDVFFAVFGLAAVDTLLVGVILQSKLLTIAAVVLFIVALAYYAGRSLGRLNARSTSAVVQVAIVTAVASLPLSSVVMQNRLIDSLFSLHMEGFVAQVFPNYPFLYNVPGYGSTLATAHLGDRPALTSRPVFQVTGPPSSTIYLRTAVYDSYTGTGWTLSDYEKRLGERALESYGKSPDVPPTDTLQTVTAKVLIDFYGSLPHSLSTVGFQFPKSVYPGLNYGSLGTGYLLSSPMPRGSVVTDIDDVSPHAAQPLPGTLPDFPGVLPPQSVRYRNGVAALPQSGGYPRSGPFEPRTPYSGNGSLTVGGNAAAGSAGGSPGGRSFDAGGATDAHGFAAGGGTAGAGRFATAGGSPGEPRSGRLLSERVTGGRITRYDNAGAEADLPSWLRDALTIPNRYVLNPRERDLDLHVVNIPKEVVALAEKLGEGRTQSETLDAIRDYLTQNYRYSLDTKPAPADADVVDDFLFDSKTGYCVHFASAFVVLARLNGIPARYVTGFLVYVPPSGTTTVTGLSAHSWAETWSDTAGWVTQEATPPMLASSLDDPEFYSDFNPTDSTLTQRELQAVLGDRLPTTDVKAASSASTRSAVSGNVLPWVVAGGALVLLTLLVLFGIVFVRHLAPPNVRVERAVRKMAARSRVLRLPDPEHVGWRAWGEVVASRGSRREALPRRAALVIQRRFFGGSEARKRDADFLLRFTRSDFSRRTRGMRKGGGARRAAPGVSAKS